MTSPVTDERLREILDECEGETGDPSPHNLEAAWDAMIEARPK